MSATVEADVSGAALHVEVRDSFDFDTSRSLLSQCRSLVGPNLRSVTIELVGVRTVRSCALGALLLLSEHVGPIGMVLRLRDCPENVEYLFNTAMLGRHFKTEQARVCAKCFESAGAAVKHCQIATEAEHGSDCQRCDEGPQPAAAACFSPDGQPQQKGLA